MEDKAYYNFISKTILINRRWDNKNTGHTEEELRSLLSRRFLSSSDIKRYKKMLQKLIIYKKLSKRIKKCLKNSI